VRFFVDVPVMPSSAAVQKGLIILRRTGFSAQGLHQSFDLIGKVQPDVHLDICELEVLEPRYTDDFVLKLLYELINKGTSLRVKLPEGVFDMTTEVHGVYGE